MSSWKLNELFFVFVLVFVSFLFVCFALLVFSGLNSRENLLRQHNYYVLWHWKGSRWSSDSVVCTFQRSCLLPITSSWYNRYGWHGVKKHFLACLRIMNSLQWPTCGPGQRHLRNFLKHEQHPYHSSMHNYIITCLTAVYPWSAML